MQLQYIQKAVAFADQQYQQDEAGKKAYLRRFFHALSTQRGVPTGAEAANSVTDPQMLNSMKHQLEQLLQSHEVVRKEHVQLLQVMEQEGMGIGDDSDSEDEEEGRSEEDEGGGRGAGVDLGNDSTDEGDEDEHEGGVVADESPWRTDFEDEANDSMLAAPSTSAVKAPRPGSGPLAAPMHSAGDSGMAMDMQLIQMEIAKYMKQAPDGRGFLMLLINEVAGLHNSDKMRVLEFVQSLRAAQGAQGATVPHAHV
jgi:hypothetical protein